MGLNSTYTLEQLEHEYQVMKEAKETALRQSALTAIVDRLERHSVLDRGVQYKTLYNAYVDECRKRGVKTEKASTVAKVLKSISPDRWVKPYSHLYLRGYTFDGVDVTIEEKHREAGGKLRAVAVSIECYEDVAAIAKERNECIATIVREALSVYLAIHKARGNNGNS